MNKIGLEKVVLRNQNLMACCPFHKERNPSWGVNINPPHFHGCFTCGARGTVVDLLMKIGKLPRDKARRIASLSDGSMVLPQLESRIRDLIAIDYRLLFPFKLTRRAKFYLQRRGVSYGTIIRSGVVDDPTSRRFLFPWMLDGVLVGVSGRTYSTSKGVAKTLPMFGTVKGQILYLPSGQIESGPFTIVEGEVDALKVHSSGFTNVGATGFGRFTQGQADLVLNSAATEIISFTDDDETGEILHQNIVRRIDGRLPVSRVDYAPVRPVYDDDEDLDPAMLLRAEIKYLIQARARFANWPTL